jgi:hypothetical protein
MPNTRRKRRRNKRRIKKPLCHQEETDKISQARNKI